MAISRKEALRALRGLAPRVEEHLQKISSNPGHSSIPGWRREIRGWLRQMKEVIPHVGKRTGAAWQERIEKYEDRLGS